MDVLRVTVPVVAGLASVSLTEWLFRTSVSVGTLVSVTVSVSLPETMPVALAVRVAVWVPSTTRLLIVPTANVTDVAPAGIVTVCGNRDVGRIGVGDRHHQGIRRVGVAGDRGGRRVGARGVALGVAGEGQGQRSGDARGLRRDRRIVGGVELEDLTERVLADHEPVIPAGRLGIDHGRRAGDRLAAGQRCR